MVTIALDEQGDFENLNNRLRTEPVFIGGILYDDNDDSEDYENEKKRLQRYLKSVCEDAGGTYPRDLHFSSVDGVDNGRIVKEVKTHFDNTIKEFLEEGTWGGSDHRIGSRKGRYYIFASLRGDHGKTELLGANVSEAVREDFASNLYLHMAENVVERVLFYNPVIKNIKQVRLELATRRVVLDGKERGARIKEYEKLGFSAVERPKEQSIPGKTEYMLTNPYNYRTAIEREMIHSGKKSMMIDRIGVKSIYYEHPKEGMVFLYLADAICSILSFNKKGTAPKDWIESFYRTTKEINGNRKNLIWAYDEADEFFDKGWKTVEKGDYFDALSFAFDGSECKSSMKEFYCREWYPLISKDIVTKANATEMSFAIKKLKEYTMTSNINQKKLIYIYKRLEDASDESLFSNRKEESVLYDLYDAGVSAYTHIGDSENAKACFKKAQKYAKYVATETFLRTRNKMVVFLGDMLQFQQALEIANENVEYHELLSDMKREIFKDDKIESLNHAIALSQRAQLYAFMEDRLAEEDFLKALESMDAETPDRLITESYLLHYYICSEEKQKYEPMASEYFGGKDGLEEQFKYLVREGAKENARLSLKFALYVFIKAVYTFYLDTIPKKLLKKLKTVEKSLIEIDKKAEKQINGHPWELIYKYLALIMYKYAEDDIAGSYIEKICDFADRYEGIVKDIANESIRICDSVRQGLPLNEKSEYTYMYS